MYTNQQNTSHAVRISAARRPSVRELDAIGGGAAAFDGRLPGNTTGLGAMAASWHPWHADQDGHDRPGQLDLVAAITLMGRSGQRQPQSLAIRVPTRKRSGAVSKMPEGPCGSMSGGRSAVSLRNRGEVGR
jgi:hypothetical protein